MPKASSARVVVLDPWPVVGEGVQRWLAKTHDLQLCARVAAPADLGNVLSRSRTTLLLMDPFFPGEDAVVLVREVLKRWPKLRILVFTHHDETVLAERLLRAGALGYLMKTAPRTELCAALRTLASGDRYVSPRLSLLLLGKLFPAPSKPRTRDLVGSLTDREFHVFQLIGAGLSVRQIGLRLGVSAKTAQAHRENIKNKLGLHTAPEVLRYAALWMGTHSGTPGLGEVPRPK